MPTHDYTPRQALDLLFGKMAERFPELLRRMEHAIDAGKDVQEEEVTSRRRVRSFRKNVPYTDEEALGVALAVLRAHLIETRKFIESAATEFTRVDVAPPKRRESGGDDAEDSSRSRVYGRNEPKKVEIEVEPETVLEKRDLPNVSLMTGTGLEMKSLEAFFHQLQELTDFA